MEFMVISVTRKNRERHLSVEETKLARAVVLCVGEYSSFVTKDMEEVVVHRRILEAETNDKAMRLYKEIHSGTEVLSCEPAEV